MLGVKGRLCTYQVNILPLATPTGLFFSLCQHFQPSYFFFSSTSVQFLFLETLNKLTLACLALWLNLTLSASISCLPLLVQYRDSREKCFYSPNPQMSLGKIIMCVCVRARASVYKCIWLCITGCFGALLISGDSGTTLNPFGMHQAWKNTLKHSVWQHQAAHGMRLRLLTPNTWNTEREAVLPPSLCPS